MNKVALLLLAGAAAYAYHKYSKMSEAERRDLVSNLKEKGKKIYDQFTPENIKDTVNKFS